MPKTTKSSSLAAKLKAKGPDKRVRKEPVWAGPESAADNGGITQSLLSQFLVCRERFRLRVIDGLKANEGWNKHLGYGNLWHTCEEALAGGNDWLADLKVYAQQQCREFTAPGDQAEIDKWFNVCKIQFPVYVDYWKKHPDVVSRTPLFQEETFKVPYVLPNGRTVYLRGKFDSVDLVESGKVSSIWIQENKTKGDIKEEMLKRQLSSGFDLQTMLYLVALVIWLKTDLNYNGDPKEIAGVRYNVIRRPLSGGRGSIKQLQPSKSNPAGESKEEYYERLRRDYIAAEPEYWFMRWNVNISPKDIERFRRECLDPILMDLCNWWETVSVCYRENASPFGSPSGIHYRLPFGLYNPLLEGGSSDLDEYLLNGNEVGLIRTDNLFPELN